MHPIIAKIGPFTIYSYGMMVAIAFLFGIFIAKLEAARKNIKPDLVYDFSFYLIIGSIIGARIYYILFFDMVDINPLKYNMLFDENDMAYYLLLNRTNPYVNNLI